MEPRQNHSFPVVRIKGHWEEAFDKFGFSDGDGLVETNIVADVLRRRGYEIEVSRWGLHNTVIESIRRDGIELIPFDDPDFIFGYEDVRAFFPAEVIEFLDNAIETRFF